jgi:predicted RNA-binding Zn-ribbon protein involved in translation (DUF1610 family)
MGTCSNCGRVFDPSEAIYRSSRCPSCGKDLKTCVNCRFYAPGQHWDCRETIGEPVRDKEAANFCDYFSFADGGKGGKILPGSSVAKSRFNALFGNERTE